jgi:hypothetical protein
MGTAAKVMKFQRGRLFAAYGHYRIHPRSLSGRDKPGNDTHNDTDADGQ